MGLFPSLLVPKSELHWRVIFPLNLWRKTTGHPSPLCSEAGRGLDGRLGSTLKCPWRAGRKAGRT